MAVFHTLFLLLSLFATLATVTSLERPSSLAVTRPQDLRRKHPFVGGGAAGAGNVGHRTAPNLKVYNHQIVDTSTGKPYIMLGVSQSGPEYACIKMSVPMGGADTMPMSSSTIYMLKNKWGVNTVRIPLNEACLLDLDNSPPQARGDAYLNYIATYVDMLIANGITPILDLHWTVGKASDTSTTDQQDFANVGHSLEFWKRVAKRFVNNRNVVFELFNEPKPKATVKMWWCLQYGWNPKFCNYNPGYQVAGMQDMINAVRGVNFKGLLLCAGLDFANDVRDWAKHKLEDKEDNLAISVHVYDFKEICKGVECIEDILAPIARFHPIVTTELGSSSTNPSYLYNFMFEFMKKAYEANIGTIGWSLNHRPDGDPHLLDNTQGKPSAAGYGLIDFIKYVRGLKVTSTTHRGGSHRALTAPVSNPLNKGVNNVEELQQ